MPCSATDRVEPQLVSLDRAAEGARDVVIPDDRTETRDVMFGYSWCCSANHFARVGRVEVAAYRLPPVRGTMLIEEPPVSDVAERAGI